MAAGETAGAQAFCRSRMGNRREQLEQGVVKQKTSWAIRTRSMGVLVVDRRVEVPGVRMATGNMILVTEPQATGADAELVRMRMPEADEERLKVLRACRRARERQLLGAGILAGQTLA